jgi:3-oxoacyl-[acyl-carrier protein] reductase
MNDTKRNWIITGGSRGIGRSLVDQVCAAGDSVMVLARGATQEPWTCPDRVHEIGTNITDPDSIAAALDTAEETLGSIDVVVNCAGVHRGGRIEHLARADWDTVLATNLTGTFDVCRLVVPRLGYGSTIINVGAVVGFRGFPGDVAYGAAKAGLSGLTQVLAVELAPRGIRVNLVVPGFVDTDMTAGLSGRARDKLVSSIPLRRNGNPKEIADVIVNVANSTYMTGTTIPTDGGLLASFGSYSGETPLYETTSRTAKVHDIANTDS